MLKEILDDLLANWKTSICGLGAIAFTVLLILGRIGTREYLELLGLILGGGLLAAGDAAAKKPPQ